MKAQDYPEHNEGSPPADTNLHPGFSLTEMEVLSMKRSLPAAFLILVFILSPAACTLSETVPAGSDSAFEALPVWEFCHGKREGLETAVIKCFQSSCEEGPHEIEITPGEIEDIRDIAINGVITGKASDMSVTGGTWLCTFVTPEGEYLLTIELYKGWIVDSATGMYTFSK